MILGRDTPKYRPDASNVGRTMTSYFDPKYWSPLRAATVGKSWMDQWVSTTAAWVDPVATLGAGTVTALLPDVLLTALSDGISRQFVGRKLELTARGRPVEGILDDLRVRRRGAQFELQAQLCDLVIDELPLDNIVVIANGVRVVPGVPTRVRAEQIDIKGAMSIEALVEWLNTRGLSWILSVDRTGLIHARHRVRNLVALVDASVADDMVRLEIHHAHWHGMSVPKALLPARGIALAPLPGHIRIVRAERAGHTVNFVLDVPAMSGEIDLVQIRNAIVAGTSLMIS